MTDTFELTAATVDDTLETRLRRLEKLLHAPGIRAETVSDLLTDDFLEFGSSGRTFSKAQVCAALPDDSSHTVSVSEFRASLLAPDTALVTYRACRNSEPPVFSLRSSIWKNESGTWRMAFHQGTNLPHLDD